MIKKLYDFLTKYSFIISTLVVIIPFFIFYPQKYANIDEHNYYGNAKNILTNDLRDECNPEDWSQIKIKDYCTYKYNIGTSVFLIPAAAVSKKLIFATTLSFFILGLYFFQKILKLEKISPIFTYLYALYPSFIYYSRTIMSEIYSITLFITAFYLLLKFSRNKKAWLGILSGILFGGAILVRYTNALILVPLLLNFIINKIKFQKPSNKHTLKKLFNEVFPIIIGGLPLLIIFLWFNNYLYGNPLYSGYRYATDAKAVRSIDDFIKNLPSVGAWQFLALNILYPGMIILAFIKKHKFRFGILVSFITMFFLYTMFGYNKFELHPKTLILGTRYYLPLIPFLIFLFSNSLNHFKKHRFFKPLAIIVILGLIISTVTVNYIHQNFLRDYHVIPRSSTDRNMDGGIKLN